MSKNDQAETAEAAPAKSKKKLMIMVIAALLLIGAGVGGYLTLAGGKKEAPKAEAGVVVPLEAVTINLADGHYLKLAFALQATAEAVEKPDGSRALDLAISQYTDMKVADLSSPKGREHAKAQLVKKVKEAYEHKVMDVYYTQFVTQ